MATVGDWARRLKRETLALYFAVRDPRTPWFARVIAGLVVAYAISPVDLIPDFIPVLGLMDDLVVVPAGIWVALKLVPEPVLEAARKRASHSAARPASWGAGAVIGVVWIGVAAWLFSVLGLT